MSYETQRENARRVPEYLSGSLDAAAARLSQQRHDAAFAFVTDTHIHAGSMSCVSLLRALAERCGLERVFCGGDFPWAFGSREDCLRDARESLELLGSLRKDMDVYLARGNHDFTIRTSWEDTSGYTMPYAQTAQLLSEYTSLDVCRPGQETYYYVDDAAKRVRWIVLDTCLKADSPETQSWGVKYGFDEAQAKWLAEEALRFADGGEGWAVFAVGHVPCGPLPYAETMGGLDRLTALLKDFKNRRAGELADFTGAKAELVAYLCGHSHVDSDAVEDNVLFVSTSSSACLQDDVWKREWGKASEELLDLFLLDRTARRLDAIRLGAGESRTFRY